MSARREKKKASPSLLARARARLTEIPPALKLGLASLLLVLLVLVGLVGVGAIEIGASSQVVDVAVRSLEMKGIERDLPSLSDPQDIKSLELTNMEPLTHRCFPKSGVPASLAADRAALPPSMFEFVTPFRVTDWSSKCTLTVSELGREAELLLRGEVIQRALSTHRSRWSQNTSRTITFALQPRPRRMTSRSCRQSARRARSRSPTRPGRPPSIPTGL